MHSTLTPPRRRTIEMLFKSLTAAALCLATLGTAAGFTISPVQLPSARLGLRPAARLPVGSSISARPSSRIAPAGGLAMQGGEKHPLHGALDKVIKENKIILFMKGSKDFPQCGFSNTAVEVLRRCNAQFETVNVLENENIRQGIKAYSNWPTIPQLYIDGEFIGGTDIMIEMYENGEMKEMVEKVMAE